MERQKPEHSQPISNEELGKGIVKFASGYLAIGLATIALAGVAEGFVKDKAVRAGIGIQTYLAPSTKEMSYVPRCSEKTQKATVKPGDNQWALEERNVQGVNLVLRSDINTRTIEQHPGDGILEPGDTVIMPERCWREVK